MNVKRILVANDYRSYRETLATALRMLRPQTEVLEAEAGNLNREVTRLRPDLVLCSRRTSIVTERCANWIELYPECGTAVAVQLAGERMTFERFNLSDLLEIVDRVDITGRIPQTTS